MAGGEAANLIDALTIGIGLIVVIGKIGLRATRRETVMSVRLCAVDFLNGAVLVPFSLMGISALRPEWMDHMHDARVSTAMAGVVGLFFILGEIPAPQDA